MFLNLCYAVIIPKIKNKNRRISDKDYYISTCLANAFTKVVEKVRVSRVMAICNLRLIHLGSSENG